MSKPAESSKNVLAERLAKLNIDPTRLTKTPEYNLCDTEASLSSAISLLQTCSSIAIDCEGLNLGVDGGTLTLVCIRPTAPQMDQNFLFDILALPNSSLQPLFDILTNPDIRKILYDGRMDFCALYHGFGVKLVNVIDLQLADVKSRHVRGETHEKQSQRQRRCFSFKQINDPRNAYKYDDVHVLQGLGPCLVDHQCMSTSPKKHVDHETWKERPLSPQHLQYAAHDVVLIDILHSCFLQDGYIDSELPSQSQLYVSLWSDAPPHPDDIFRSHPLLPLDILKTNPSSPKLTCPGCARLLSLPCFPVRVKQSIPAHLANHCWVCLAVPQWLYMMRVRKEQRERQKAIRENENMRRGEATAALFGGYSGSYTSPGRSTFVPASPSNHSSSGLESPLSSPMPNGRGRGQSPRATWQPSRGTGQSLRGTGQPSRGTGQPSRGTGQPSRGTGQPLRGTGQPSRGTEQSPRGRGNRWEPTGVVHIDSSSEGNTSPPRANGRGSGSLRGQGNLWGTSSFTYTRGRSSPRGAESGRGSRGRGGRGGRGATTSP